MQQFYGELTVGGITGVSYKSGFTLGTGVFTALEYSNAYAGGVSPLETMATTMAISNSFVNRTSQVTRSKSKGVKYIIKVL